MLYFFYKKNKLRCSYNKSVKISNLKFEGDVKLK